MLILILGLSVIAFVIFILRFIKTPESSSYSFGIRNLYSLLAWFFGILVILSVILIVILLPSMVSENALNQKITMYQEENAIIEQDIDRIVDAYLEHEKGTFSDLKTEETSITLVTLFPELKSDTLVQQQLEIYVSNNAKIKELKEKKINLSTKKWFLYFGR